MLQAAKLGDLHTCPSNSGGSPIIKGASSVYICGIPAARVGDQVSCSKPEFIITGEKTVLIEGKPAARIGDMTEKPDACPKAGAGVITTGCPVVFIGADYQVSVLKEASLKGAPFCDPFEAGQIETSESSPSKQDKNQRQNKPVRTDNNTSTTKNAENTNSIPQAPPPPPADKGAGAFNSVEPGILDHASEMKWRTVAGMAEGIGYTDAARHIQHYLDGSGKALYVKPENMLRDMPKFKEKVDADFNMFKNQIQTSLANQYDGKERTEKFIAKFGNSNWTGYYATKNQSGNWFYATGGFSYTFAAVAKTIPPKKPESKPIIQGEYQMHVYDRYNWDKGKGVNIGEVFSVSDESLGSLHQAGLAKEYDIKGSTSPSTFEMPLYPDQTQDSRQSDIYSRFTNNEQRNQSRNDRDQQRDRTGKRSDPRRERY